MANVDIFPLLKLPYLPLANVIQQFNSIHKRIYLATLSRRTAILVKSLRDIKVLGLKLTLWRWLNMSVIYLDHGGIRYQEWIYKQDPIILNFPFSVDYNQLQKLIDTTFFIFGLSGFDELVIKRDEDATIKMSGLQNLLRNVNTIKFDGICFSVFFKQALAAFPSVRNVSMTGKPNSQLLNKKLEILEIGSQTLYDLGLVNCESLQIQTSTCKNLNHFLKKWIQGKMPRLKHICIQSVYSSNQDEIFEGIEYRKADLSREMTFKFWSLNLGDPKTTVVHGGVDIKSKNGARATITTRNKGNGFLLWNMNTAPKSRTPKFLRVIPYTFPETLVALKPCPPICSPQTLPANITVPGNSTFGLYANVTLFNGLKGVNDMITVIEMTGYKTMINSKSGMESPLSRYIVIPGAQMTIQITTKSVVMNSQIVITVDYGNAPIGNTSPLKTGGDMNYFDMNSTRDGVNLFSSVTFTDVEPIFMFVAIKKDKVINCYNCFVIDGTFENQTQVYRLASIDFSAFTTKSNAITIVSFHDGYVGFVFNPVSETDQFKAVFAVATVPRNPYETQLKSFFLGFTEAVEIVNFESTGIIMTDLTINSDTCQAYVVSGPPNNSSQIILDLSTKPKMPFSFDLKYFTVINMDCDFSFGVMSFDN